MRFKLYIYLIKLLNRTQFAQFMFSDGVRPGTTYELCVRGLTAELGAGVQQVTEPTCVNVTTSILLFKTYT